MKERERQFMDELWPNGLLLPLNDAKHISILPTLCIDVETMKWANYSCKGVYKQYEMGGSYLHNRTKKRDRLYLLDLK